MAIFGIICITSLQTHTEIVIRENDKALALLYFGMLIDKLSVNSGLLYFTLFSDELFLKCFSLLFLSCFGYGQLNSNLLS